MLDVLDLFQHGELNMIRINHRKVGDSRHYYHGMNHVRISLSEVYSVFVYLLF